MTADECDSPGPSVARPLLSPGVIYLIGVPAVGKYTIAKEIGRLTRARVVDNQLVNLPVFHVLGYDGRDTFPFPKGAWQQIEKIAPPSLDLRWGATTRRCRACASSPRPSA